LKADYETILCAVDIDSEHLDPVRWAAGMASEYRARLVLVHAIQWIEYSPVTFQFDAAVRASIVDAATERLSEIAQSCGIEHGDFYIDGGTPYNVVRAAAQERNADLVVIGRPAKGGVMGRLRSNSYAIIRESPCPVVSV
jgi:nucleotide-binding universal stress UspA family protein